MGQEYHGPQNPQRHQTSQTYLEPVVEPAHAFDEHIRALVVVFVSASDEHVERLVQVQVEVTANKTKSIGLENATTQLCQSCSSELVRFLKS